MSFIAANEKFIVTAKGLYIDIFDRIEHSFIEVPSKCKPEESDHISGLAIANNKYLAVITSISKQLIVFDLPLSNKHKDFILPRSASKVRFTVDKKSILVADKTGDVLIYNIEKEDLGTKLLGHLSLLLDVLQTTNKKYIISSDRDEKIRVSCYPNTYNIETYCLGHKEFVSHLEMLPHDENCLVSSSGDGTLKFWDFSKGLLLYTINTYPDINEENLKQKFITLMDEEGIEVNTLPIVNLTTLNVNETCSLFAVTVYSYNYILIYKLTTGNSKLSHSLHQKIEIENFPSAICNFESTLYAYHDESQNLVIYKLNKDNNLFNKHQEIKMFENISHSTCISNNFEAVRVLYKRKFNNVQEYQERKKQRLDKSKQ